MPEKTEDPTRTQGDTPFSPGEILKMQLGVHKERAYFCRFPHLYRSEWFPELDTPRFLRLVILGK
jgi:hypothetical protein